MAEQQHLTVRDLVSRGPSSRLRRWGRQAGGVDSIEFACQNCNASGTARPDAIGKVVTCPKCGQATSVQSADGRHRPEERVPGLETVQTPWEADDGTSPWDTEAVEIFAEEEQPSTAGPRAMLQIVPEKFSMDCPHCEATLRANWLAVGQVKACPSP